MKNFLFFLFTLLCVNANGQAKRFPVKENGTVVYEEVVNCDLKKSALFSNAQKWIAKSFGDYKKVIQFEDVENGKLIFKGKSEVEYNRKAGSDESLQVRESEIINYTFTIDCRENKYRYTIDNILIDINQSWSILGEVSSDVIPNNAPNKRYEQIILSKFKLEALEKVTDSIKTINTSDFKKKDLKEFNLRSEKIKKEVSSAKSSIETDSAFYDAEVKTIENLILSLKSAMCVKDDF
jgi:hypothetical protein